MAFFRICKLQILMFLVIWVKKKNAESIVRWEHTSKIELYNYEINVYYDILLHSLLIQLEKLFIFEICELNWFDIFRKFRMLRILERYIVKCIKNIKS